MRKLWIVSLVLALCVLAAGSVFPDLVERPPSHPVIARRAGQAEYLVRHEILAPAPPYDGPYSPGSPGDTVSMTYYDLQANVNPNKHIVCDDTDSSGVHFTVMFADDPSASSRHQVYNYYTCAGGMHHGNLGIQIDSRPRAGYGTIAVLSDGRAVAMYHGGIPGSPTDYTTWIAIDLMPGMGIFQEFPMDTVHHPVWPSGTVHWENDYIEVGAVLGFDSFVVNCLWGGGWTTVYVGYLSTQEVVGSTFFPGGRVLAAWREMHDQPGDSITDVVYRESTDYGATWGAPQSVTGAQHGDTLMVWDDFDACYDAAGEPHFVYALLRHLGGLSFNAHSILYHWSPSQGQTEIARAYWDSNPVVDNPASSFDFGSIMYPSIGINPSNGYLHVVWTQFADIEGSQPDTSQAGISNGEIYLSWSSDNGLTWAAAQNLTNSSSPDCDTGQCDDDRHSNIALLVNDTCHIMYQNDKWAGQQIVQGENPPTNNPILYIRIPPCWPPGVEEAPVSNDQLPMTKSQLFQNRPNPFSSATTIPFRVSADGRPRTADDVSTYQLVNLSVYDLSGRLVRILVDGPQSAGVHTVVWDGRDSGGALVPSGVYFYRLRAGDFESVRKMVVIR